ncbi:hypothetical protein BH753_gp104 [Bacillus phage Shbh1]|uniref:Uncharacterized protein n=1 Tax=Bacillus phage Shbh1 TaxID=1796992 RepID=A0A142F1C9_9CAUD|nr:hypothetical protein BH753_gp104 [Bacillus phage Shbh1]AMQ66586.1 hypothetical protein [Bacillus phage Shbh1]
MEKQIKVTMKNGKEFYIDPSLCEELGCPATPQQLLDMFARGSGPASVKGYEQPSLDGEFEYIKTGDIMTLKPIEQ